MPTPMPPAPALAAKKTPSFYRLAPLVIAAVALVLRVWGVGWGLPNAGRYFSYHPDESIVAHLSLVTNPFLLLLDTGTYNYGSLAPLVNSMAIHLVQAVGLAGQSPVAGFPSAQELLTARLVTALLGAATCCFLWGAGRLLYGTNAGIVAAILYAIAPLAVQHGHFCTVDVPAVFWISGSLYFAARYQSGTTCARDLLWAGLWAGFAAATKYNAGLVLFAGGAAWAIAAQTRTSKTLVLFIGGAVLGFLVGCPGFLLNFGAFREGLLSEANHVRDGHGDVFTQTPPGFIFHITFNLSWGLGLPLLLIVLTGVGCALYRRRPGDVVLLAFALPYYVLIGLAQVKFARYTLPLFPPLFLMAGALLPPPAQKRSFQIVSGLFAAAAAFTLLCACAFDAAMTRPDTRDEAADFIRAQKFQSVGFAKGPWFYSPPLTPLLACPYPRPARDSAETMQSIRLVPAKENGGPVEWSVNLLAQSQVDAVPLSEFEYADAQRIALSEYAAYRDALKASYPQRKVFAQPIEVFGLRFSNLNAANGLPTQNMPEDMRYTNPVTIVFSR